MAETAGNAILAAVAVLASLIAGAASAADAPLDDRGLGDIVVTATRRAEDIHQVPIDVTAYSQAAMDELGVRQFDDVARFTPDLQFTHTAGSAGNNSSDIAIRGVFSDVGAATTGIYIDDTAIQMRNVGYWNANAFPQIFDLERVEVLRGPQGTLFGASAEGGAVRFITPEPSLDSYSATVRADVGYTLDGAPSYGTGIAAGGPIMDRVGVRASAWGRQVGGYIDRVSPDTGQVIDRDINRQRAAAGKLAVAVAPDDRLRIIASLYYQDVAANDRDQYWSNLSRAAAGVFRQADRVAQPSADQFFLPAAKIVYTTESVTFFSNSSFYRHRDDATLDYTTYFGGIFDGNPASFSPGDRPSQAFLANTQTGVTQEFRMQSAARAPIEWTGGIYYSRLGQRNDNRTTDGQAVYTAQNGNLASFLQHTVSTDKEIAAYGNVTLDLTDRWKLSGGTRVSRTTFGFAQNGAFEGFALTPVAGSTNTTPLAPKISVSYQADVRNFFYASAAEGYRPGGVNAPVVAALCVNEPVSASAAYRPDSLWSLELGGKNTLFGQRLHVDSSVYALKWRDIQQSVRYTNCGFSFVGNLGSATGVGGDISAQLEANRNLLAGISAGYTSIKYDRTFTEGLTNTGLPAILTERGERIGGPPLSIALFGRYRFSVLGKSGFCRIDYAYRSKTPEVDHATINYDPTLARPDASKYLSMRAGIHVDGWEISAYGNNIARDETPLSVAHDIPASSPVYLESYRPLTVGLTAILRY